MFLSIIIVNWNGKDLLERCVSGIVAFPPSCDYEIVVVDNASTDESVDWLREKTRELAGKLRVIFNTENVGFGRANNQAMHTSTADYFFLLNSDAEPTVNAIDTLISRLETEREIGAIGPRLVGEDGSIEPTVWRNPPAPWEILVTGLRIHKLIPRRMRGELLLGQFWPHTSRRDVRFLHGAAMMIRREVFEEVGGFDEDFFMYGEDMEYSLRIFRAGWRLVFLPAAEIVHKRSKSTIRRWGENEKVRVQTLGYMQFYKKSLSGRQVFAILLANLAVIKFEGWWRILRGSPRDDLKMRSELFTAELRSIWPSRFMPRLLRSRR